MSRKRILVCGDAILDHYVYGYINRQSPEDKTVPVLDKSNEEYRLGGCLNVAANLNSLDRTNSIYVLSVIDDHCRTLLCEKGINSFSIVSPRKNCLVKTRFVDKAKKKQLLRLDNLLQFKKEQISEINNLYDYIEFNNLDCIVISDYNKGLINDVLINKLINECNPNTSVFIDTKKPDLSTWDGINNKCFIKINSVESARRTSDSRHPVIVTHGSNGATLNVGDQKKHFPTKAVYNPEVTGCGDTFLAGLVVEFLRKNNLQKAIEYANMIASKSAETFGTTEVEE